MLSVAVIYYSQQGATHSLCEALCLGIKDVSGVLAKSFRIVGKDIQNGRFVNDEPLELVDACDAVVFGSPTYMGGPAAQFKAFADASSDRWESQTWSNKIAAGFTCGSSPSGDQMATLQYFSILAAQHGMHWVNLNAIGHSGNNGLNRLGMQLGGSAWVTTDLIDASDLATMRYLGKRVALTTLKLRFGVISSSEHNPSSSA